MEGVEAVIDKDRTAALLAMELQADALLLLTDVTAVFTDFGGPNHSAIGATTPDALECLKLAPGSMGPKVEASIGFVRASGALAGIGQLTDARAILEGRAGTRVSPDLIKPQAYPSFQQKSSGFTGADQPISVWTDDGGTIL